MADTEDTETLAEALAAHCMPEIGRSPRLLAARFMPYYEGLARAVLASDWLLARDERIRADEREAWASWLETWLSAVGPEPPTAEAVVRWLRADTRPFGCYANTELAGEVEAQ